ncbi:MAG: HDOD domain-containing protein [Sterolibacteriaceae bacterium]|jgi:EAL and modified HD-GYP domain-containing signal transduction protein|nr:HDOD domain-containing protein [Sterolibacteriaceae bacterium]MBK9086739.1 HDOD domain-containing protein [Sterolibacteriaceae bacterium]
MTVLLTHEPVVNKSRAITANRLVVHAPSMDAACDALNEVAPSWPMERTVLLGLSGIPLDATLVEWELPENTLIELPASLLVTAEGTQLAEALTEKGIGLCVTNVGHGEKLPANVPLRFGLIDIVSHPRVLPGVGVPLAVGLTNAAGFDAAMAVGYAGATGWFFLNGGPKAHRLSPGHGQIVRVLNLVRRDADIKEIEAALKLDVALSYKLLRYINSAGFGLPVEIQSFRHAVTMLGYDNLNKWLSLLLVTASKQPGASAIMQAAIARGRFMEQVGHVFFDKSEYDNLFITGAFSLLNVLLGTSMEAVLGEMHLPDSITSALTGQGGVYKPFLDLARSCEDDPKLLARQAESLGLDFQTINRAQLSAVSFADTLQAD